MCKPWGDVSRLGFGGGLMFGDLSRGRGDTWVSGGDGMQSVGPFAGVWRRNALGGDVGGWGVGCVRGGSGRVGAGWGSGVARVARWAVLWGGGAVSCTRGGVVEVWARVPGPGRRASAGRLVGGASHAPIG